MNRIPNPTAAADELRLAVPRGSADRHVLHERLARTCARRSPRATRSGRSTTTPRPATWRRRRLSAHLAGDVGRRVGKRPRVLHRNRLSGAVPGRAVRGRLLSQLHRRPPGSWRRRAAGPRRSRSARAAEGPVDARPEPRRRHDVRRIRERRRSIASAYQPPVASFTVTPTASARRRSSSTSTPVASSAPAGIASYDWDFGDGSPHGSRRHDAAHVCGRDLGGASHDHRHERRRPRRRPGRSRPATTRRS